MSPMLFFDLDDTLVNDSEAAAAAVQALYAAYRDRIQDSLEAFAARWRLVGRVAFTAYLEGHVSYREQGRVRVRTAFGCPLTDVEADGIFEAYLGYYDANLRLFLDVTPLLRALGDRPLGIITNGAPERQRTKLACVGLQGRFDPVITAGEVSIRKPDARLFHVACARAGVAPAEAVHVGNNLEHDARAAQAAGLQGIWLNRDGELRDPTFEPQIRSLMELPEMLEV